MAYLASLMSRGLVLLVALLLLGPGAWANPGSAEDRGRSEQARERSDERERASEAESEEPPREESGHERPEETSGTGSDQGEAEDDPAPSDEPGPDDGHASERGDRGDSEAEDESRSDRVDATFSASPARVRPGDTSTLSVTATNSGDETIASLELIVELPPTLKLVSSDPSGVADDDIVRLGLGSLSVGASTTAEIVVLGTTASGAELPVRFALIADDHIYRHELMVEVDRAAHQDLGLSASAPLLVQVGDTEGFSLTVSNSTAAPLRDVVVIAEIAPELDVAGVVPVTEADAVQLGKSASGEDIVWIFHSLEPGESVDVAWTATAVAPGDLEATSSIRAAVGERDVVRSRQSTYLGYVEALEVAANDPQAPQTRRRVVTKMVPVSSEVAASPAGLLPVTGGSPGVVVGIGALLIALGLGSLWLSGRPLGIRRVGIVAALSLLLTAAACVSSQEPSTGDAGNVSGGAAAERAAGVEEMPEPEDEVLGVRIEREPQSRADGEAGLAPSDPIELAQDVPTQSETVLEEVVTVESVLVPPPALPVRAMTSRSSDNAMSITWTPPDLVATSSRTITADAADELLVSVQGSGSSLSAIVGLTNLSETERLAVRGKLSLEVAGEADSSTLYSEAIDVVLEPGASIEADFTFALPAGTFYVTGGFLSD